MSKDKKGKGGDYDVGYGRPPKKHQFKKGTSGNPAGAPSKRKRKKIDVAAVLNEPLLVKNSGVLRKMPPFEVGVRRLVERALKQKDLNATLEFLELCESFRLLVPPPADPGGGFICAHKGMRAYEWLDKVAEWVPASSPDADDDDID